MSIAVIYLMFIMIITTMAVAVAVLVLQLHNKRAEDPPPLWLRNFACRVLAPVTCTNADLLMDASSKVRSKELVPNVSTGTFGLHSQPELQRNAPNELSDTAKDQLSIRFSERERRKEQMDLYGDQYKMLADIIDVFCARLFFLTIVVGSLIILWVIPAVKEPQSN